MKKLSFRKGFNDRMYILNFKLVWIFTFFVFILTALSGKLDITDMSAVSMAVSCAFVELGAHTSWIVWKAKVENCRKYKDVNRGESLESEV